MKWYKLRSEVAVDSKAARKFNSDCLMWVARRPDHFEEAIA